MSKRPLVYLTIALGLGIFFGNWVKANFWFFVFSSSGFLILGLFLQRKESWFSIFILLSVFCLGASLLKNTDELSHAHISRFAVHNKSGYCILKGAVGNEPAFKNNKTSFVLASTELQRGNQHFTCTGQTLVSLEGKMDLVYGEELILKGFLYPASKLTRNVKNTYTDYLRNQGVYSVFRVDKRIYAVKSGQNKARAAEKFILWLKNKVEEIIYQNVSPVTGAVLCAMILGEKQGIPPPIYNAMIRTGTVHILVVSGFNVGIVAFILLLLLKLMRLPKRTRVFLIIPLLIFYCLLTGVSNPVLRATIMAIMFLCAYLFKKEPDIYNALALAALFILVINPRQLFDVGFQLSFASVISIAYFYPRLKAFLRLEVFKIKALRFLLEGCAVSFSAWLGTMGFIAYYFRLFSPITVLANIIIVPLATLITLCGFSLVGAAAIFPALAHLVAVNCELLVSALVLATHLLMQIPGACFSLA